MYTVSFDAATARPREASVGANELTSWPVAVSNAAARTCHCPFTLLKSPVT